ncbi:MAG: H-NS histone family protein [Pseudomonadota bacterium]
MTKLEKLDRSGLEKARAEAEAKLKEITEAQAGYDARRVKELRAEIEKMLAEEGYTLDQLVDVKKTKKRRATSTATPKYRHPENESVTWSGRGRQPGWFKDHVDGGGKAEDLAI